MRADSSRPLAPEPLPLALGLRGGDRERDLERDRLRGAESTMAIGWAFDCGRYEFVWKCLSTVVSRTYEMEDAMRDEVGGGGSSVTKL